MTSDWKLLHPQTSIASIPPLLVKYEFRASSYRIWVTDLSNVWTEALDQRPLVQRAWDIETDIDPIESDQRQMLLQKIRDCLDEGPSTKLALSRNEGSDDIQLTAFSPLPKPLKALRWPFFLTPSPRLALTNELVIPLLIEQLLFRKRLDSLLEILNDKDHVISKLTDKMQTEGLELGKVFPGAIAAKSSRKAISKEDFGRAVKGLGPFDESQWRTRWKEDPDVPENCQGLLSQLFARDTSLDLYRIGEQLADEHWWERISTESPLSDDVQEEVYQSQSQKSAADDFQVCILEGPSLGEADNLVIETVNTRTSFSVCSKRKYPIWKDNLAAKRRQASNGNTGGSRRQFNNRFQR